MIPLSLRERFEALNGKLTDEQYAHVLELALDDQRQYVKLTEEELNMLLDPERFPPNSRDTERLDEIRERLLETMAVVADIVKRRKIK